ncbi:MAG: hypothetical protein M5R36_29765 [Deltaproteobacteria bacterium]|nr:hypothetical protein [Deltaproteobacteria bacterium]
MLNDEINRLNDRARLEREAARLGFVKIEPAQKIVVDPGDAS